MRAVMVVLLLLPPQETPPADGQTLFLERVLPIFQAKCLGCHGEDPKGKIRGGLDLRTRAAALKGGDTGPSLLPGKPDGSLLMKAVLRGDEDAAMPPKEADRLTAEELEAVRAWIAAGAPWAEPKGAWGVGSAADRWAFYPLGTVAPPAPAGHPIDAFVTAKLAEKGLRPSGPADPETLLRRVTIDLTGLPPTPQEVEAFLADRAPGAWERRVDALLASPAYGEQWARHWLDVVRYADTSGFSNDFERPNAWRYRDWVIRSLNRDVPFRQFILDQIAGDEIDPQDPEKLIASGFLRMGPWEHTAMSVAALTRQFFLDDVTHSTAATFLGLTMRCARCHDHKFDPLPTRDYYRLQAVFAATQFVERPAPFLPEEATDGFEEARAEAEARLKEKGFRVIEGTPDDEKIRRSLDKVGKKRKEHLSRELLRYEPLVLGVYDGPPRTYTSNTLRNGLPKERKGEIQEIAILAGGMLESPGEKVEPGVLSAVPLPGEIPLAPEKRRLALAEWVAHPDNPLTARVLVNRVWQHHFGGKGIVATPNNFGKMGKRPTHPELLDWLARRFLEDGGSLKKLHRLILTSETYRRDSRPSDPEALAKSDPSNDFLSVYPVRRLAAEELRDSLLAITGELRPSKGGPGVFPEIHWEVALQPRHVMGGPAPAYQPSPDPGERHRRTIYAYRTRTLADPLLEVFNRPGTEMSCERRDETTVTPQAFALMNGQFTHDRALALAVRLEKEAADGPSRIDRAFRLVYGRPAGAPEKARALRHLEEMTAHHRATAPVKTELPLFVRREMIEEFTGQVVRWDEELDRMRNYRRDLKPWDVGPETRGLAELCLVLFNSNEFLYVR